MPIYEYACRKCGHQFEILIRSAADLPARCPTCGAPKPSKAFSTFAVATGAKRKAPVTCEHCPAGDSCASAGGCCSLD